MKVLFLSYLYPPDPNGGATRVRGLARAWASSGVEVVVGTSFPSHPYGRVRREDRGKLLERRVEEGVTVVRSWRYATPNRGFVRRVWAFLTAALSLVFVHLSSRPRPDVIVVTSPPLFIGMAGWVVARLRGIPLVLDVRDLWPQQAIDLGVLRNRWMIEAARWMERRLYADSVTIVVVTEVFRRTLIQMGLPERKLRVIRNGADCDRVVPALDRSAARERVGLPDQTIVSYVGTFGLSQGLMTLVDAARLVGPDSGLYFLFVGDGAEWERISGTAKDLPHVEVRRAVPPSGVLDLYHASDIGVVLLRDLPVFSGTVPSKVFEFFAAGIPVVVGVWGEARELVELAGAGVPVTPEDPGDLARALVYLGDDAEERARLGASGRRWVEQHANRRTQGAEYLDVLGLAVPSGVSDARPPPPSASRTTSGHAGRSP